MIPHRRSKPTVRTGAILALVLAGLFIASLLGLALIEFVLRQQRQLEVVAQRQQCLWLAESGLQRARAKLAAAANYSGETWTVSAEDLGAARPASVTIEVAKPAGPHAGPTIRVEARFPDDPVRRTVVRRELVLPLPSATSTK